MNDQTPNAVSSPADPFNGQEPTLAEFQKYRATGEVAERFKPAAQPADSAPADDPKEDDSEDEDPKPAPDSDPDEDDQEQPQKVSRKQQKRIDQLLAERHELRKQLEAVRKPDAPPASSAPRQPQTYAEYRQAFKPTQFIEEYAKAHPEASYEDANAAMADHLLDVRDHFRNIETRVNAEKQALESKVSEARERYEDFDDIKTSFLSKVVSDQGTPLIPLPVLGIINDSDVLPDLLYVLGENSSELDKFIALAKSNPNKAIRYVANVESQIAAELAKPKESKETPARGDNGQFKPSAPEKRQTAAPKPVSPVGGGSSRAFDVSDESLSADEWMRKRNDQVSKRG